MTTDELKQLLIDIFNLDADRKPLLKAELQKIHDPRFTQELLTFLSKTPQPERHPAVIFALGIIGDQKAIPYLIPLLDSDHLVIRVEAELALARLGHRASIDSLIYKLDTALSAPSGAARLLFEADVPEAYASIFLTALRGYGNSLSLGSPRYDGSLAYRVEQEIFELVDKLGYQRSTELTLYALEQCERQLSEVPTIDSNRYYNLYRIVFMLVHFELTESIPLLISICTKMLSDSVNYQYSWQVSAVADGLAQLGDNTIIPHLIGLLLKRKYNSELREKVSDALQQLGGEQYLGEKLASSSVKDRCHVANIICHLNSPTFAHHLWTLLSDPSWEVRKATVVGLGYYHRRSYDPEPMLFHALQDACSQVRVAALINIQLSCFGREGWKPEAKHPYLDVMLRLLEDSSAKVRYVALRNLRTFHDPAIVKPIIRVALEDNYQRVRYLAIKYLAKLGYPCAIEPLKTLLQDSNQNIRAVAQNALQRLKVR